MALAGTAIGGVLLPSIIAGLVTSLLRPWQRIGVRVIGSWIAAGSSMALAFQW